MTNFEKIKQMNIEQLAELLFWIDYDVDGYKYIGGNQLLLGDVEGIKEWLESEVE